MRFRRAGRGDAGFAVLFALAGAGATVALALAPSLAPLAPACPFHAWTGLPCPGCGATRAALALAHGEVGAALAFHPLGTLALLALGVLAVLALPWIALRLPVPVVAAPVPLRPLRLAAVATLAAHWAWLVLRGV